MKACPSCGRLYPVDAGFCPVDGAQLISATQVPVHKTGDDERVGQLLFERYQVRRVVADGGMGRVYEALDLIERRNVAVKILHPEVARDPIQVERFKREFEVSKQLPHHHIVEVMDFRPTVDGSYALIMEFLYGEELRATIAREQGIAPARLVRLLSQVALGLDEAHARSLVHRDLKPDNLFLCQTPEGDIVKILDFGSVKDKAEGAKKLTVMGTTIGSPFYMSPEQAQGLETLDHRADVWALGAITFEAITGHVPFQGANGPTILLQILTKEPPPVSEKAGSMHPALRSLDPVLARAFKKTASLRFESVGAFADALGAAYGLEGVHARWAETPEGELKNQIDALLPGLLDQPIEAAEPRTAQDSFFGDDDSLGEQPLGAPRARTSARPASASVKPAPASVRSPSLASTAPQSPSALQSSRPPAARASAEDELPLSVIPGLGKKSNNNVYLLLGAVLFVVVIVVLALVI